MVAFYKQILFEFLILSVFASLIFTISNCSTEVQSIPNGKHQDQEVTYENDDSLVHLIGLLVLSESNEEFRNGFWTQFLSREVDLRSGNHYPLSGRNRIYSSDIFSNHFGSKKMYRILVSIPEDPSFDFEPTKWKNNIFPKILEYRVWYVELQNGKPKGLDREILLKTIDSKVRNE